MTPAQSRALAEAELQPTWQAGFAMPDKDADKESVRGRERGPVEVMLNPGDHFVGDKRHCIRTLLGSCVSITLWHRGRRIGAMSHFLLASRAPHQTGGLDGRYGDEALRVMTEKLQRMHVAAEECEAKIFGGGNMFPEQPMKSQNVGLRNGEAAREMLRLRGIEVVSESLFGVGHRQIIFDVATGNVWARQINLTPSGFGQLNGTLA
jgi:chemotaxis protein CheD